MDNRKLSLSYRFLRKIGLNFPEEEYGNVSLWTVIKRFTKTYRDSFMMSVFMNSWIFSPIQPRKLRPWTLRKIGCKVGRNVFIGSRVWIDAGHADLIEIGDNSHVDATCVLLCHKRQLDNYYIGDDYHKLPYKTGKITIGKGCSIGTGTIVMPGVTIGEGSIIGAGALVTRDIPAWSIAIGRPAKVVKDIPTRQ